MSSLHSFLTSHKKEIRQPHTHTWFAAGPQNSTTSTLHIPSSEVPVLRRLLVTDIGKGKRSLNHVGPASVTEKITRGQPFRFAADLDFKTEEIKKWGRDKGYTDERILLARLKKKLRDILLLYRTVVAELTTAEVNTVNMIAATRLPYKIHLHFSDVIVDTKSARVISAAFAQRLADEHADIYSETVVDSSVYATGLRMLYCHKGGMTRGNKRQDEQSEHEALFGPGTYCDAYYVTDLDRWEQNRTPSVKDLELTSLEVDAASTLTPLRTVTSGREKAKMKGKASVKRKRTSDNQDSRNGPLAEILSYTATELKLDLQLVSTTPMQQDGYLIVSTKIRECPFADRIHQGNHLYIIITEEGIELKCHDEECTDSKKIVKDIMPESVQLALRTVINGEPPQTEENRLEAMDQSLSEIQARHPQMDVSGALSNVVEIRGGVGGSSPLYSVALQNNRWCPICKREHDGPENCVIISQQLQQIMCKRMGLTNMIDIPLRGELKNVIFAVNNLNVSVNMGADPNEVKEFGTFEDFPRPYDNEDLNRLCYTSLNGRTRDVAKYVSALMKGQYIYQDKVWRRYTGEFWKESLGPDDLMTGEMSDTYRKLQLSYRSDKQKRWIEGLLNDLANVNKRRGYLEDLERLEFEHAKHVNFNGNPALLPFENGVYDSRICTFRTHAAGDYITRLVPYSLPKQSNPEIRQKLHQVLADILPKENILQFLLTVLSLSLEGSNRHNLAMIWTGIGGNGKSFLKSIVAKAFGDEYHKEPPASFLTGERPSSDKPNTDLLDVQLVRSLFTSEPEAGKKINTGFLKFITGQDPVRIRGVHSSVYHEYIPRFIVSLLCNTVPLIEGGEDDIRGIWRRLKIIHFGTVFTDNPDPNRPEQKLADTTLGDKAAEWAPEFMLLLMDIYKSYLGNDRRIVVPEEVQRNLQEQKEDNDKLETWLTANVVKHNSKVIHLHRITRAHDKMMKKACRVSTITAKLKSLGYEVSCVDRNARDSGCCKSSCRAVIGADLLPWCEATADQCGKVDESKGVMV